MGRSRYRILEPDLPHFFTCAVVDWFPVFTRPHHVVTLLESWRWLQERGDLAVHGWVVMENHLHFIASGPQLGSAVSRFKSFTARRIVDGARTRGESRLGSALTGGRVSLGAGHGARLWQRGSHPQAVPSGQMMRQKLEYLHYNPVRRGYVDDPVHWRYSSARSYAGLPALLEVDSVVGLQG